jgi:hypothetical protein
VLNEIVERPKKHLMEDGVVELMLGVQFFLAGIIFWCGSQLRHGSALEKFYSFGQSGLFVFVCISCTWGTKRLKERVIAPRAGYVLPREEEIEIHISSKGLRVDATSKRYLIVAGALVLWTLGLLAVMPGPANRWSWYVPVRWRWILGFCIPLFATAYFASAAWRYGLSRYYWLAAWSLMIGAFVFARHDPPMASFLLTEVGVAGGCAVMGAIRLRRFLKTNAPIEDRET